MQTFDEERGREGPHLSIVFEDRHKKGDILNLFFIAFNKYTGKADKNQAFTPDHITILTS